LHGDTNETAEEAILETFGRLTQVKPELRQLVRDITEMIRAAQALVDEHVLEPDNVVIREESVGLGLVLQAYEDVTMNAWICVQSRLQQNEAARRTSIF
jgi:hypothetical protein